MALFIDVDVSEKVASDPELARKLVEVCPVNIFALGAKDRLEVVEKNLDECTLCELCLAVAPPEGVKIKKLYGEREVLVRRA